MRRRRGGVTLEFALLFPLQLALAFALVDWSWFMFQWLMVTTATQRGVRLGAGVPSADGPEDIAESGAQAWLDARGIVCGDVYVSASRSPRTYGEVLEVAIDLPFEPLLGLVPTPGHVRGRATALWYGDFGS